MYRFIRFLNKVQAGILEPLPAGTMNFLSLIGFVGKSSLVGGFNPSAKYARQIGSFPHVRGGKIKNI